MTDEPDSEYHDVLRVDADTIRLWEPGYAYFQADAYPLPVVRYARDMTLARGRILYEVWDYWRSMFIGYIVPQGIFNEALANRETPSLKAWEKLPYASRRVHHQTHRIVVELFPRIPLLASKLITEALLAHGRKTAPSSHLVEETVIDHAKHRWTSYEFRVSTQGQAPDEAAKSIKRRMREVLEAWLPPSISWSHLVALWVRYDLLEDDGKNGALFEENRVLLGRPTMIHWYGGAETNANLISASALPPL